MTKNRRIAAAIEMGAALLAAAGLLFAHVPPIIASGVAVVGILIGTGVAKGKFSKSQDANNKNG